MNRGKRHPATTTTTRVGVARPPVRRLLVTIGVAGSLLLAGVAIRAAAQWSADSAPLVLAPVSVASVQQALAQERARSAALEGQIATLEASSSDLGAALEAAEAQLGADQSTAEELRASLAAAQAKLDALQAALEAASTRRTARVVSNPGPASNEDSDDSVDSEDHAEEDVTHD